MLGFEIKFREKVMSVPLDACVIIAKRQRNYGEELSLYIDVGLYNPSTNESTAWIRDELYLGDLIEITVRQIENISTPIEIMDIHESVGTTKEEADKRTLEDFLKLKKELEDEGLI